MQSSHGTGQGPCPVSSVTCSLAADAGEGSWQGSMSRRSSTSLTLLLAVCHRVPTSVYPSTAVSQCHCTSVPFYLHFSVSQHHRIPTPSSHHVTASQCHHIPTPPHHNIIISQHHPCISVPLYNITIYHCHHIPVLLGPNGTITASQNHCVQKQISETRACPTPPETSSSLQQPSDSDVGMKTSR